MSAVGRSSPLHVHLLIDGLGPGGAEALLADLAAAGPPAGLAPSVGFLFRRPREVALRRLRDVGVEPVHVPVRSLCRPSDVLRVRRHLEAVGAEVVHTHLGYADVLGGLAARTLGVPSISTQHVVRWDGSPRDRLKVALMGRVRRHTAARVVAVSDAARAALLARRWDDPARVVTVPNGTASVAQPGAGAAVRRALGVGADEVVLAMASVLREGKGHLETLAALRGLDAGGRRVRLLVAGDGPLRDQIARAAEPLGDQVLLLGHRGDVPDVLDAADVLVHPSGWDALPTVILEGMAAGVPTIATAVGGIPELVVDGETGVLLAPGMARSALGRTLAALVRDPARRARMGAAARSRYEARYTADRWAGRLRALYEEVLDERATGRCGAMASSARFAAVSARRVTGATFSAKRRGSSPW
jgi:glycosyltransferase involved in cell wall biosynthesis